MNEHQVSYRRNNLWRTGRVANTESSHDLIMVQLIYIALQRSKTAREAIKVFGDLTEKYGYASEGESFSVSDANEAWILEMIGKGEGQLGRRLGCPAHPRRLYLRPCQPGTHHHISAE